MDQPVAPTQVKSNYISNPFQMISPSANALGVNIGTLFAMLGVQLSPLLLIVVAAIVGAVGRSVAGILYTAIALGAIASLAIIAIALISIPTYAVILLSSVKGEKIALKPALARAKPLVWRMLWMNILFALAVLGGLVLFIIPGLIFMAWFSLGQYVMVSENLNAMDSLKRSRELVRGRVWEMWSLSLLPSIAVVVPILGSLLNFILSIVLIPAVALRYTQLASTAPETRPAVHWTNYGLIALAIVASIFATTMSINNVKDMNQQLETSTYSY